MEVVEDTCCVPLISQSIDICDDSLITHVNTAGDPRHVVTLLGWMVKIAEPIAGVENTDVQLQFSTCMYIQMYIIDLNKSCGEIIATQAISLIP